MGSKHGSTVSATFTPEDGNRLVAENCVLSELCTVDKVPKHGQRKCMPQPRIEPQFPGRFLLNFLRPNVLKTVIEGYCFLES